MNVPKHIFKKYDIRGLIDEEVTPELAESIGKAFGTFLKNENQGKTLTVAVGRDMRDSSPGFQDNVMTGLTSVGVNIKDVGLVSTPAFYFSIGHLGVDGGMMVSASHNPAKYNGFKLAREKAVPVSGDTGILDIRDLVIENTFENAKVSGQIEVVNGMPELATKAEFEHAGSPTISGLKIVADTANGMGAQYLDELFKLIDCKVTKMYWSFDGSFPNHEADPFKPENTEAIRAKVKELGADVGITTDGDGDRLFFIDNTGEVVDPAILRGLLSQIVLRSNPGATICYDIRPGKITKDMIEESGGKPSITRVGHSLIKEQMMKEGAVFGGESSGHFFYKFNTGVYEGPVTVVAQLLNEMIQQKKTLSEIVKPLNRYFHSGEINFIVDDKDATIAKIKAVFSDGELSELDGISIAYDDFWLNVRPSNTEPKLRMNLEAVDEKTMQERRDQIIELIQGNK